MNYAILSAGEGSRLRSESITIPKPLLRFGNTPMIERLISIFGDNNADNIHIISNNLYPEVHTFLKNIQEKSETHINVIYKTTPSSAHSFYELIPGLKGDKFCLTTVDTIFDPKEFKGYIEEFKNNDEIDGLMGVTSYIDDESPLYIETDENMNILGFHDTNKGKCNYISGGIYSLNSVALEAVQNARDKGISRMRNLQRELIEKGLKLKAYPFSKILDIDHVSDIAKASEFLHGLQTKEIHKK